MEPPQWRSVIAGDSDAASRGKRDLLSRPHWGLVEMQELLKHQRQGSGRCVLFCEAARYLPR